MSDTVHIPVMVEEVLSFIKFNEPFIFVDATIGNAGHSLKIFEKNNKVQIFGIDKDREILDIAKENLSAIGANFNLIEGNFARMDEFVNVPVDVVLMDLGISSMQIDKAEKGFSYRYDFDIDMRMGGNGEPLNRRLKDLSIIDIANILEKYGDFRRSKRIAERIYRYIREKGIKTTYDMNEAITGKRNPFGKEALLSRVYQAFRIFINDEYINLQKGLYAAMNILKTDGILIVISYHSGEDRIVKYFMRDEECISALTKKPKIPLAKEIKENKRARSAKLRAGVKIC